MGNDFGVKQNCANPRSQLLTFDGLTDDSFCLAYTVASATYDFENAPEAQCLDFYVQGGDGQSVVKTPDICPRGNRDSVKDQQQGIIKMLAEAGFQDWTKEMYALSEALTPMVLHANMLRTSESLRLNEMRALDNRITEAKKILCWHDGYKKDKTGLSPVLADALEHCMGPEDVEQNEKDRKEELDRNMKNNFTWGTIPDKSDWGPSFWKSIFSLEGRAEETVLNGTVQLNSLMSESAEKTLLLLDLPNTRKSMERGNLEEIRKTLLIRQESHMPEDAFLRQLSTCDIETLAFIKAAVPTLSLTMKTGNTTVKSFLADHTFLEQAKKVLGKYEDDVIEAQVNLESAIEFYRKSGAYGEFSTSVGEVRRRLRDFPKIGDYEDLDKALTILDGIEMSSPDLEKQATEALRLIESYEQTLAEETENDMDLAVNAKIFMIDEFARRSGRTEFGKVLLATLWMNQGLDATVEADRIRRFVRAQELIKRVSRCKLSTPELRWLDEVNRFLNLLGAPVRRSPVITPQSCYDDLPPMAFDASTRQCLRCDEDEFVEIKRNSSGILIESYCSKQEEPKKAPAKFRVIINDNANAADKVKDKDKKEKKEEKSNTEQKVILKGNSNVGAGKKYKCTFSEGAHLKANGTPEERAAREAQCNQ